MYWLPAILIFPYSILLLKIYRSLLKLKPFYVSSNPSSFISVVVACHNEENNLPSLISQLSLQNYPANLFEVIIVNDRSTDRTAEIANNFCEKSNIKILTNTGIGKKQALRTGILAAKADLIITTDADCRMGKEWIKTIGAFYEMNIPDMIICPVRLELSSGIFGKFQELEFLSLQGVTAGSSFSGEATMCNGANLAFKKEVYLKHSDYLHDEINSGDDIFLLQSLKRGDRSKIFWLESSDALVTTASSPSLLSFLNQRSRWISKVQAYNDKDAIILGIIIIGAIILEISYFIACLFNPGLILILSSVLLLKSVPDFFILFNTSVRYNRKDLMWWFLPSQLIYPFYVLSVVFYSLISRNK
jgi:cellulose synthase/poly-beta-1,6-N-acetylglucosamine synthase-like glycosyltransferase